MFLLSCMKNTVRVPNLVATASANIRPRDPGGVVRIGPNELHFADPKAYHDVYSSKIRWNKEERVYKSFNEDNSSFGFLTYGEAKIRRDALNRSFSYSAIESAEDLIVENIEALCAALEQRGRTSTSVDTSYAFRCMTMDIIVTFYFGKPINALQAPNFRAPILVAMDASLLIFNRLKYSSLYKNMILKCPATLSKILSPYTAGLIDLQQLLVGQINELIDDPEKLKSLPHNMTIYHRLISPEAYRDQRVPSAQSLYEEAQALLFGGADTVGNTLMVGTFHLLKNETTLSKLKSELREVWPDLHGPAPKLHELEGLPFLNAVIKESLRLFCGPVSGLPRVTPPTGAIISNTHIPPNTIVSCGSTFVHYNSVIFPEPSEFRPERWLESPDLEAWLVPFSRGPRMCLGINLAWAELRLSFTHVYRKFDISPASPMPDVLQFRDTFLPTFYGTPLCINPKPVLV